jgi:ferredoxin
MGGGGYCSTCRVMKSAYKILVDKPEGSRPPDKPGRIWK